MIARTGLSYHGVDIKPGSRIWVSGWRSPLTYLGLYHEYGDTYLECMLSSHDLLIPVEKFRRPAIKRSRGSNG